MDQSRNAIVFPCYVNIIKSRINTPQLCKALWQSEKPVKNKASTSVCCHHCQVFFSQKILQYTAGSYLSLNHQKNDPGDNFASKMCPV